MISSLYWKLEKESLVGKEKQNSFSSQFYKHIKLTGYVLPCRNEETVLSDLAVSFFKGNGPYLNIVGKQFICSSASRANMLRTNLNWPEVWGLADSDYTTAVAQELPEKGVIRFIKGKSFEWSSKIDVSKSRTWFNCISFLVFTPETSFLWEIRKYFLYFTYTKKWNKGTCTVFYGTQTKDSFHRPCSIQSTGSSLDNFTLAASLISLSNKI